MKSQTHKGKRPYAVLSVSDKTGIPGLAERLAQRGYGIISTGGTQSALEKEGITDVVGISELTEFAECLDGRLKTLHPMVLGSVLYDRSQPNHVQTAVDEGFVDIAIVVVNLYPFRQVISKPGATLETAIENIDIGGPTMLRSAAKNYKHVYAVVDPKDYTPLLNVLDSGDPDAQLDFRFQLAAKVFATMVLNDSAVAKYLGTRVSQH